MGLRASDSSASTISSLAQAASTNQTLTASNQKLVKRDPVSCPSHGTTEESRKDADHRALREPHRARNGICRFCYSFIVARFSPSSSASLTGMHRVCDLKMAVRDPACLLCAFLFTITTEAAAFACLPGPPRSGMYALHAASFSDMFFDPQDHCWFTNHAQPAVFFISPLYTFGAKARDWALQYNSCFMIPGRDGEAGPHARELKPQVDLVVAKEWLRHCGEGHTHPDCNPVGLLAMNGFQVIDYENRKTRYKSPSTSAISTCGSTATAFHKGTRRPNMVWFDE